MIIFAADNHYDAHPGAALSRGLMPRFDHRFMEDEWGGLADASLMSSCSLLILNLIAGTGSAPMPGSGEEQQVKAYMARGRPVLLLHGASAAFWHWTWWRPLVGFRWVRGEDPDGFQPSTHPTRPYRVEVAKCRHPLARQLRPLDLPEDEIYIRMEQTCPTMTLMETTIAEGAFPQCYVATTPWGGQVIGFLPGHRPEVAASPAVVETVSTLIRYLLPS